MERPKPKTYCIDIPATTIKLVAVGKQIVTKALCSESLRAYDLYTYRGVFYFILDGKVHWYSDNEESPLGIKGPGIFRNTPTKMTASWRRENNLLIRFRQERDHHDHIKFAFPCQTRVVKIPKDKRSNNRNTKPFLEFYYESPRGAPDEPTMAILKSTHRTCLEKLQRSMPSMFTLTFDHHRDHCNDDNDDDAVPLVVNGSDGAVEDDGQDDNGGKGAEEGERGRGGEEDEDEEEKYAKETEAAVYNLMASMMN